MAQGNSGSRRGESSGPQSEGVIDLCTLLGFQIFLIPREVSNSPVAASFVGRALELERAVMDMLGDASFDLDVGETLRHSSFAVAFPVGSSRPTAEDMVGAVRFMTGTRNGNKTLWDLHRLSPPGCALDHRLVEEDPQSFVDAMSLAPSLQHGEDLATLSDMLLGVCRCIGGALFQTGRAGYVTGFLHHAFLRHASSIGYPFDRIAHDDVIDTIHHAIGPFTPVFASLEVYDQMVRSAQPGSHLSSIREAYLLVCSRADELQVERW